MNTSTRNMRRHTGYFFLGGVDEKYDSGDDKCGGRDDGKNVNVNEKPE